MEAVREYLEWKWIKLTYDHTPKENSEATLE